MLKVEKDRPKTLLPDWSGDNYHRVLRRVHQSFSPRTYLEIGCFSGESLALAECDSIGIDPDLTKCQNVMLGKSRFMAFQTTSDLFYEKNNPVYLLGGPIDFAFLDGMHLCEYLLRDFINTEKYCARDSLIAMHDCIPTDAGIGSRDNNTALRPAHPNWWTGDVWKILPILRKYRPDLKVRALDSAPTGLVIVTNLDATSTSLQDNYDLILSEWLTVELASYGLERFIRESEVISVGDFFLESKAWPDFRGVTKDYKSLNSDAPTEPARSAR